ncbi:HNH endonuclease [Chroococcidiopsis sp. TS-821]
MIASFLLLVNDISNLQTLCRYCNQRETHHLDSRYQRHYNL